MGAMLQQRARQPTPLRGRLPATERHYSEKSTRLTVGARPKSDPTRRSIRRASYEKAAGTTSTPTAFGKSSHPAKCHRPAAIGLTKKCCASLVVSRQTIYFRPRPAPSRPRQARLPERAAQHIDLHQCRASRNPLGRNMPREGTL
jgi:hypothetical protein